MSMSDTNRSHNTKKTPTPETPQDTSAATDTILRIFRALVVLILGGLIGYFVYATTVNPNSTHPFELGLDLAGGSHLVYDADVSNIAPRDVPDLMSQLRDVIETRIREKAYGAAEPIVQVETSSFVSEEEHYRLVVELPGVTDIEQAIAEIGRTPLLEFKLIDEEALAAQEALDQFETNATSGAAISNVNVNGSTTSEPYITTGLTGRYLDHAQLVFGQGSSGLANEPTVQVEFNDEGATLFEEITREHTGERLAIFLDGERVSAPVINETIPGGRAVISGDFTPEEARELVNNLKLGALPIPIELQHTQTIGASLGSEVLGKGIFAGSVGLALVMLFMLVWYRIPGLVACVSLLIYIASMLALFKLVPVTLTAAGLAGFILSIGMAVDANVLVFERMKEEYRAGAGSRAAARTGFARAWSAIRDGNVTSMLSAIILYWFGTSIVQGFALVFGLGVLISMISAIAVTRTLLVSLPERTITDGTILSKCFTAGFSKMSDVARPTPVGRATSE